MLYCAMWIVVFLVGAIIGQGLIYLVTDGKHGIFAKKRT